MSFKIIHERPKCIACGSCAAVAPKFWEMSEKDGLADLKGCTMNGDNEERIIDDKDATANREAAEVCPVQIIHVEEIKEQKKK
ncbi:MAG TPA: ferredoxin [Candidatus Nanoarchaeia archaeon]|nr:ferredoxin [Candidatus Nanoarchaeia archaeon]